MSADPAVEQYWTTLKEHSWPEGRAAAALLFLDRTGQPVTAEEVAALADVDRELARESVRRYHTSMSERIRVLAIGASAAHDVTAYAYGPRHPRRRRRLA